MVKALLNGYRIIDDTQFDYSKLRSDLFAISGLEADSRHAIYPKSEDLTNDRFKKALLNRGYTVEDQSRGGESGTEFRAGERDLLIRNSQTKIPKCIIEAFVLNTFNTKTIESHLQKLLHNYDTVGNKENYAISYVKSDRFFAI